MISSDFCKAVAKICLAHSCCECPICDIGGNYDECFNALVHTPELFAKTVLDYIANRKTRQSEYIKLFPYSYPYMCDGTLDICPNRIRGLLGCGVAGTSCEACKRKFWLEEIK